MPQAAPPMPPMGDMQGMPQNGGMPGPDEFGGGNESEFDTGFDAGVGADEDEDPKKFIQQLTGKLSQSLNTYNNENDDEELSKYVGKMIVKAAAKGMDDSGRKELIKSINQVGNESDDEGGEDFEEEPMEEPQGEEPMPMNETSDYKEKDFKDEIEDIYKIGITKAELKKFAGKDKKNPLK